MNRRAPSQLVLAETAFIAAVLAAALGGCTSESAMDTGGTSPHDFPTPRTGSILPLQPGNEWAYSDTRRDSGGTTVYSRAELNLAIPHAYGVKSGSFELLGWSTYDPDVTYDFYAYEYEAEEYGRGVLIAYRDIDVDTPGVYLMGTYDGDSLAPYVSPVLWLAYPAVPGMTWQCNHDSLQVTISVVSTDTSFHFPDKLAGSSAPVRFVSSCYLYREDHGGASTYRYFHKDYGELAGLRYENGRLVRTYILTLYSLY